jgi:hypothetical protein
LNVASPNGITVAYNYVHHCSGYGLHCYSAPVNFTIYGNVIVNNSFGLLLTGTGHTVVNNTISHNDGGGLTPDDEFRTNVVGYAATTVFENNVMWGQSGNAGDISWDANSATCTFRNNCYEERVGSVESYDASDVRTDPQFAVADPSGFSDLRLKGGSSCIRAGIAQDAPYSAMFSPNAATMDFVLTTMSPMSIGAFAYGGLLSRE